MTWSLATWAAFSYVFCVVYAWLTPSGVHMTAFLEQVLPGYQPQSWQGFLAGLVQGFLYGAYAGVVYVSIYNMFHRAWARQ